MYRNSSSFAATAVTSTSRRGGSRRYARYRRPTKPMEVTRSLGRLLIQGQGMIMAGVVFSALKIDHYSAVARVDTGIPKQNLNVLLVIPSLFPTGSMLSTSTSYSMSVSTAGMTEGRQAYAFRMLYIPLKREGSVCGFTPVRDTQNAMST
jgi:hypothetical protein